MAAFMKIAPRGPGLSVSSAGLLLTAEMIANGVPGLAAGVFERVSSRALVITGFIASLLANLATAGATGLGPLIALRIVAGAGLGLVVIAASRFVAASKDPDRLSSLLMVASTILNGAVLIAFGNSSPSVAAVFGTLAALAALGLVTAAFSAGPYAHATAVRTDGSAATSARLAVFPVLFLIAATGLLNTADAGLYTLTSVVGEQAGVGEEMLGYILTGAMVAGIVAAIAAGWLRTAAKSLVRPNRRHSGKGLRCVRLGAHDGSRGVWRDGDHVLHHVFLRSTASARRIGALGTAAVGWPLRSPGLPKWVPRSGRRGPARSMSSRVRAQWQRFARRRS